MEDIKFEYASNIRRKLFENYSDVSFHNLEKNLKENTVENSANEQMHTDF